MPVSPQLPAGWIPIDQTYTGTDPKLLALQRLRDNVESVSSDAKGPDNPLFTGVPDRALDSFDIRPRGPRWKPTDDEALRDRQLTYLNLCTTIHVLELVADRKRTYDDGLRSWLIGKGVESKSVDDAFQIENVAELQST